MGKRRKEKATARGEITIEGTTYKYALYKRPPGKPWLLKFIWGPGKARRGIGSKRPRAPPPPPPPECPICLEHLDDASPALACRHRFHAACVQELVAKAWADGAKRTRGRGTAVLCPLCREQSYVQ